MNKLKPCPFCGGDASTMRSASLDLGMGYSDGPGVGCLNCHFVIQRETLTKAAEEWNVRPYETHIRNDAIEECATTFDNDADKMEDVWKKFLASGSGGPATSYHTVFRGIANDLRKLKEE